MNCPRCSSGVLDEQERDGVVVDVCLGCRGLWLDRGELEKLVTGASREFKETPCRPEDTSLPDVRYHIPDADKVYRHDGDIFD
jgi:uncharacterized protein